MSHIQIQFDHYIVEVVDTEYVSCFSFLLCFNRLTAIDRKTKLIKKHIALIELNHNVFMHAS